MYIRFYIHICFILLCSILRWVECAAQLPDFNVQILDESNGIQTGDISRIIRDKQGFLWMLSARGLQRFDGQNVKKIEAEGENLLDIVADSSGTMWVTTERGVKKYINDNKGFLQVKVDTPGIRPLNKLQKLQLTPDNQVWINSRWGLYKYDNREEEFKHHPIPGLPKNIQFYRRIFSMRDYQLYLADVHTLFLYDAKKNSTKIIPFEGVRTVIPFAEDIAWVTNSMLRTFEVNFKTKSVTLVSGLPLTDLNSIIQFENDDYLVNTSQGCYKYNRLSRIFRKAVLFHSGKELPNDENYTSYYDTEGMLWILCQEGILFFRPLEHNFGWLRGFTNAGKKWSNNIHAITEDKSGNIWLGTVGGFSRLNVGTGQVKTYQVDARVPNNFKYPWVRSLVYDGKNLIVGAAIGEPVIFNPVTETFKPMVYPAGQAGANLREKLKRDWIATIFTMQNGNQLIVGEETCYILEKDSYKVREQLFLGTSDNIQTAVQEPGGNFWMGSYNGLLYVNKNFKTLTYDDQFKPNNLVSSLLIRNDSTVWCGSIGLFEVVRSGNSLKRKLIFQELRNQRIAILYQDKGGRIWIGADGGLYRYDEAAKKLEWFDVWDNIQNKRLNANSLLEARDGHVYIGGFNGLNYFKPGKIQPREEKLNVMIAGVRINQDDSSFMLNPAPLQLGWKQNSVEFQFVTTYFRNPQKLIYRYRLIGLDNGWLVNGRNNKVRFSSLPPNEYTFTVAASLDGIKWYETRKPFSFVISPPFWQKPWFIVLCILVIAGLAYWLFKKRVAIIRKQTDLRERVFEIEMKALRAQMNPHFIFNCLNSINRYIVKSDNATASLYLTRFSKLIRLILDNSNSKNVLLSNELEALKLYIEMEGIRFDNKFDFNISLDENVYPDSIEVPSLIIQPYVENAIWHGLLHKETNGSLCVKLSMLDENMLRCIIEDNGIGREKAMEYKSKSATGKKSLGMKLTEDRIAILNQYAQTNASVEIVDLRGEDHEASGTRVIISIPV